MVFMGLAFVAAGGALVLGRSWTRLDLGRSLIVKHWGLMRPMKREEMSLRDFHEVCLECHTEDSTDCCPVVLKGGSGRGALEGCHAGVNPEWRFGRNFLAPAYAFMPSIVQAGRLIAI
jgi:hypothetical protein